MQVLGSVNRERSRTARRQEACLRSVPTLDVEAIEAMYETCRRHAFTSTIERREKTHAEIIGRAWVPVKIDVDGIPIDDVRRLRTLECTAVSRLEIRTFGHTVRLSCSTAGHCLTVDDEEPLAARTFSEIRRILQMRSSRFVALVQTAWFVPAVVLASPVVLSTAAQYFAAPVLDVCGVSLAAGVLLLWLWWEYGVWRRRLIVAIEQGRAHGASGLEER